ncbi:MAG: hypothetical protein QOJ50_273 [Cryptosporangiaceae bacterium]|nr:hypothetical protein [Cryptosporangiaceae bacterium]
MPTAAATPAGLLAAVLAADPARPLITQYDDATGERTELSAVSFANWVAKTANLLQDTGYGPGSAAAILLPPHWQNAAIQFACWSAGVAVAHGPRGGAPEKADVVFAGPETLEAAADLGAADVYALSLAPLAMPLRQVPPGVSDYASEVRAHGDRFVPYSPVDPGSPALDGDFGGRGPLSHSALAALSSTRATELGLTAADRVLVVAGPAIRPVDWLLAPVAAGASVVLCRNADPGALAHRAESERVTATLNCQVDGIRALLPEVR